MPPPQLCGPKAQSLTGQYLRSSSIRPPFHERPAPRGHRQSPAIAGDQGTRPPPAIRSFSSPPSLSCYRIQRRRELFVSNPRPTAEPRSAASSDSSRCRSSTVAEAPIAHSIQPAPPRVIDQPALARVIESQACCDATMRYVPVELLSIAVGVLSISLGCFHSIRGLPQTQCSVRWIAAESTPPALRYSSRSDRDAPNGTRRWRYDSIPELRTIGAFTFALADHGHGLAFG